MRTDQDIRLMIKHLERFGYDSISTAKIMALRWVLEELNLNTNGDIDD